MFSNLGDSDAPAKRDSLIHDMNVGSAASGR